MVKLNFAWNKYYCDAAVVTIVLFGISFIVVGYASHIILDITSKHKENLLVSSFLLLLLLLSPLNKKKCTHASRKNSAKKILKTVAKNKTA